ncbi:nitrile hydratase subunit beta [Microvirga tunisiensis]|uniref:Nitrile hydratase subunit beta n=1 Tax=Microvirga tunisiensis TaxID=2108360 RepID=A0A5N7N207_9HYPH|nr:nitrile hydratase subunit beta [Microvirga tunisiensis]MPR11925.1 nitrile hydratase subunit beta [Microvirga tunisiensis]MPR29876.1 nitrile hydratase subunit beta [Microvirga tunisiensis]
MNGAQDLGGMMGFGPIQIEQDEPWFHAEWERRAFGLTLAMDATRSWNIDMSRHARESLPPAEYLTSSYYEIWTRGVERLAVAAGLVSDEELRLGQSLAEPAPIKRVLKAEDVPAVLARGGPAERPIEQPARFAVGDRVRTRNIHPRGHTRLPRYARSRIGVVELVHGAHVFPDTNAHGQGEQPEWLYTVCFSGRELWGQDADATLTVSIDAWESYLEPA